MCIDGTKKTLEELDDNYKSTVTLPDSNLVDTLLRETFSEVKLVNATLLKDGIACLIVSVQKNKSGHIRSLHQSISAIEIMKSIKMILYVEHTVDPYDLTTCLWRFCNNLDPKRDFTLYQSDTIPYSACMGLDGTRKTKELDNFQRDWPNIIVADEITIKRVDEKWNQLGIGEFITSPSLKYKSQLYGEEAVVES